MSRDKNYQRMLNSKQWRTLREWKLTRDPLCERCLADGFIRAAVDVHHIEPVEGCVTLEEMERRCFSLTNLQSLCISCHANLHREERSHSKEAHQQRSEQRLARWIERHGGK